MKCTIKEQETCDVEKMTCKGCAYNEKSADELFKELGYVKEKEDEINIIYEKGSSLLEQVIFNKVTIHVYIETIDNDYEFNEGKSINMQELQAINKKVKELGWYE